VRTLPQSLDDFSRDLKVTSAASVVVLVLLATECPNWITNGVFVNYPPHIDIYSRNLSTSIRCSKRIMWLSRFVSDLTAGVPWFIKEERRLASACWITLVLQWIGRSGDRISVGASYSAPARTCPGAHPTSYTMGTGFFSRGRSGRGVALITYPSLVPRLKKELSYTLTPPLGLRGLLQGELSLAFTFLIREHKSILWRMSTAACFGYINSLRPAVQNKTK
jgi:hypothetical protein